MRSILACAGVMVSLAAACPAAAAPPPAGFEQADWLQRFASPRTDWINDIIPLRDGTYLAVGYMGRDDANAALSDWTGLAVKFTGGGEILWTRAIDNPGKLDAFWAAREAEDGTLWLTGMSDAADPGGDARLTILDPDGAVRSQHSFGGTGDDRATGLALAPGGGVVLAGQTTSAGAGERDIFVVRADADGGEAWRRTFGGPDVDRGFYVEATADGGFVVSGVSGKPDDLDMIVLKLDGAGRELWRRTVGAPGGNDLNHGLAVLADGRIVATGYTQSWGSRVHDLMAVTLSPSGEVLQRQVFGGPDDDRVMTARAAPDGAVWVTGYTRSLGAGDWDVFVASLDPRGVFRPGVAVFGTAADDRGTAVLPLADGTLLLGGYSASLGDGGQNGFVLRLAAPDLSVPAPGFERRESP